MEKIYIKNFGPIAEAEVEIKRLNLFIGQQATGKSTIAKLVAFFRSIKDIHLLNFDTFSDNFNKLIINIENDFKQRFYADNATNSRLTYWFTESKFIDLTLENGNLNTRFSHQLNNEISELIESQIFGNRGSVERIEAANKVFEDDLTTIFIPAGRSLLTHVSEKIGKNTRFENFTSDVFLNDFIRQVVNSKTNINTYLANKPAKAIQKTAKEIIDKILVGKYSKNEHKDFLYLSNNQSIPFTFASSGQMEAIWLALLIYMYMVEEKKAFIIFEEPEANLFPETQFTISQLISLFLKQNDTKVMVTTHSPFIVAAFNNMIFADELGRKNNPNKTLKNKIKKIVGEEFWIDIADCSAFSLAKKQGNHQSVCESIIDDELHQILIDPINSIISNLNSEYNKLMNL